MDQNKIDELQEELRKKTEAAKSQIEQAEQEFSEAIEEEKGKEN